MDQRRESLPGEYRFRDARLGKILCPHQQLHQAGHRKGICALRLRLQVRRPVGYRLQPSAQEPQGLRSDAAEILCHKFRRPAPFAPMQSARAESHVRHHRRIRGQLCHHAQSQPFVDTEAGRFLRRIADRAARGDHLVPEDLRRRKILYLSPCHRAAEQTLRRSVHRIDGSRGVGELSFALRGCMERWSRRAADGADRLCEDSPLAYDLTAALLGHVGRRLYTRHQQPRGTEDSLRGKQSRQAEHIRRGARIV